MSEKKVVIEGYQPEIRVQDGYQPTASVQNGNGKNIPVSTPVAKVNIVPPRGGTGEVNKK